MRDVAKSGDLGLKHHARYWYDLRPVYRDGRKGAFAGTFSGLTRGDETAASCRPAVRVSALWRGMDEKGLAFTGTWEQRRTSKSTR